MTPERYHELVTQYQRGRAQMGQTTRTGSRQR